MRKVMYALSISLDGFIETTQGDLNWTNPDEDLHQHFNDRERMIDLQIYGRRLYENMSAFWPTADVNPTATRQVIEYAQIWRSKPKVVFSKTLDQVGENARLVRDDIAGEVNRLKEGPGEYIIVGGAGLAGAFMQLGLIDEYWLYIHPVILGGGKPMFPRLDDPIHLQLVETRKFGSGVVMLKYQRADASP